MRSLPIPGKNMYKIIRFFQFLSHKISEYKKIFTDRLYESGTHLIKVLYINLFFLIFSLVLVLIGFVMIPVSIINFGPVTEKAKLLVGLIFAAAYIFSGFLIYFWMFRKARWNKMFRKKSE